MREQPTVADAADWRTRSLQAFAVSTAVHAVLLIALWAMEWQPRSDEPEYVLETVFAADVDLQEFSQELDASTEIAETENRVADVGVTAGQAAGGADLSLSAPVPQEKVYSAENLRELKPQLSAVQIAVPTERILASDMGSTVVQGEVGAVVEGYGAALGRITQELTRIMRQNRVLVAWLFDESESMKDDQERIREEFHKVYEELGMLRESDEPDGRRSQSRRNFGDVLLSSIVGFGQDVHFITPEPTSDIRKIRTSIDDIPVDATGEENMCRAIAQVVDRFGPIAKRTNRQLLLIVVSDESGDDGDLLEEAIERARQFEAPVYFLGREAVFGYPYARIVWTDPVYGLRHWLPIRRGPETANAECLQWDGLHSRWDSFSSGFGPYEQVRLAKETGGIFFLLPDIEENLAGVGAREQRIFDFLAIKQYAPLLLPRREYERQRAESPFRSRLWQVIKVLNPHEDGQLNIRELHYAVDPAEFREQAKTEFDKAVRALQLVKRAIQLLEEVRPQRATEASERWRADYDLALAQCLAYRVRLFQFLLALDQHARQAPRPVDSKTNRWNVTRRQEMLPPDPRQVELTKIDLPELEEHEQRARALLQAVIDDHPGTPWAQRAAYDLGSGFGMTFVEHFRDPRYDDFEQKVVKLPKF